MKGILLVAAATLLVARAPAGEIRLEQVISREDPAFHCERAHLAVGRDGRVYLASGGTPSYVLRLDRDGGRKVGGTVTYALTGAAANADGLLATSNAHFAHKVALLEAAFTQVATVDDFLVNDQVGWDAPGHVEAGARDFYGLDQHRDRIVRISPGGKRITTYPIPHDPAGSAGLVQDFRVCESREVFYLLARSGPIRCVGFDGRVRWAVRAEVSWGEELNNGGFDVDDDGTLYTIGPRGDAVMRFTAADGAPLAPIPLRADDIPAGLADYPYCGLRVHGGDLFVRRRHPLELFRRHDGSTGALVQKVEMDHERLIAECPTDIWTARRLVPFRIRLESTRSTSPPRWRVWGRTAGARDYREFPLDGDRLAVPAGCAGLFQVFVTPDVRPGHPGGFGDYRLKAWVEIRQADTTGSATVLAPDNRTDYSPGEEVVFQVDARSRDSGRAVAGMVRLVHEGRTLAQQKVMLETNSPRPRSVILPAWLTAALVPGDYSLAIDAPGLSSVPAILTFGASKARTPFRIVQYGDYGPTYPTADVWSAPDVTWARAERTARLGFNLLVDRLGDPTQGDALNTSRWRSGLEAMHGRLESDPLAVAPAKAWLPTPFQQTMAAYSALGIDEMAILMRNDAGLPLGGPGFDNRKPAELLDTLARVTKQLSKFPSFRGWTWSSNWWVFEGRGANAAVSPEERSAYLGAEKRARETGSWDPVLDRVSDRRLGYAVAAQELFNRRLAAVAGGGVTAVASPYRSVESYPPISLSNVDEVDLQAQWEQIALPYHAAHGVDYYKRPGRPAWCHPEVWNDAGTGDQIVPTLFQALMRGADGVGESGSVPSWVEQTGGIPADSRLSHQGMTSIYRSLNALLRDYGPWLTTLQPDDRVAIVVSGRMMRIDAWGNVMGTYFARLLEAYCTCLHAHQPARFVFAEDVKPDGLKAFEAVLVIGQRVELEPSLGGAMKHARATGVRIFRDGTCRDGLVAGAEPLGIAFDHFEKDQRPASDDAAYWRLADMCKANATRLRAVLRDVQAPAETENPEVFLSRRRSGDGRFLFVVNNTTPDLEPGQLWRVSLCSATRVPVVAPVRLGSSGGAVYDIFAGKRIDPKDGLVEADLRSLPARLYAILPEPIGSVELRGPGAMLGAGEGFAWSVRVLSDRGQAIRAGVPVRVQLRDDGGMVVAESRGAATTEGLTGAFRAPLGLTDPRLTLEAVELFSGQAARLSMSVSGRAEPVRLPDGMAEIRRLPVPDAASGGPTRSSWTPADRGFGPHVRDIAVTAGGSLAVLSTMNWDHNLYALNLADGSVRWRQRVGHYFAFDPRPMADGVAVQGFDFRTAEGYHLYRVDPGGKLERRFALYGVPKRLPHRFVPAILNDRVNNFSTPADGRWVAAAGDLGLAVWDHDGTALWRRDGWPDDRHTATLAALDAGRTLLAIEGLRATAHDARSGRTLWELTLAATGEIRGVEVSADGKTCAVLATTAGGRVFVVRDGKPIAVLPTAANELAIDASGSHVAVAVKDQLKLYSVADGLRWVIPADDTLHYPRFSPDGHRLAASTELGTLYVSDLQGRILLERDTGTSAVPAWLPDGGLLLGTWAGQVERLGPDLQGQWRTRIEPSAADMRRALLTDDAAPTTRIADWGNAETAPAPITPNLLDPRSVVIRFRAQDPNIQLVRPADALADGQSAPPPAPWLFWGDIGSFAETSPFNVLELDTYRTRMRVTAITLVEDPHHPESWLRDTTLEAWNNVDERWVPVQRLLSNAALHTHRLTRPAEASRFRLVMPWGLCGNLRLAEIVLHGEKAGPAHPDLAARRPVAVLFDEGDELKDVLVGSYQGLSFRFDGAYHGGRCLELAADRDATPTYVAPFGHVVPSWDFEIRENPAPGQYRYAQFAWRALSPSTRGLSLQLDGDAYGLAPRYSAGEDRAMDGTLPRKLADSPPRDWQVVRVDLWELVKKPTRIRGLRLGTIGGPAAFDRILLGRTPEDLPALGK